MAFVVSSLLSAALLMSLLAGCQRGHYTDDRQYVGDPERVESASEGKHENQRMR